MIAARSQGSPGRDAVVSFTPPYIYSTWNKSVSACLPFLVVCQPLWIELVDDLLWRVVLLDLALKVKADHIARVDLARQFEELGQTLLFCLLDILRRHVNDEVHVDVIVVFLIVLQGTQYHLPTSIQSNVP